MSLSVLISYDKPKPNESVSSIIIKEENNSNHIDVDIFLLLTRICITVEEKLALI